MKYKKTMVYYLKNVYIFLFSLLGKLFLNQFNILRNNNKKVRKLEIGPGFKRINKFETLNIVGGINVDYVFDASKKLPFKDTSFDIIYASHILEHIPWFKTKTVLNDWKRILKSGGILELWVPDGLKICEEIIKAERNKPTNIDNDKWYKFNPDKNPYLWANGRIFTYGDGTGKINNPNWHRSFFTPNYLKEVLQEIGLTDVQFMDESKVRGYNHGWINLGIRGTKR